MTPILSGRIQTKLFLLLVIAPVWNALLVIAFDGGWFANLVAVLQVLLWTAALGVVWELLWHALQQLRWEKDWPIMFGLLQWIPEGLLVYLVTSQQGLGLIAGGDGAAGGGVSGPAFLWSFTTTVLVTWLFANGPMRVLLLRWRFEGGRIA